MSDDNFDELLAQGVRDYNPPGAVPREEMWERIQAARAKRRAASPLPAAPNRRAVRAPGWIGAAVAATLVLSVGVVIGRRLERSRTAIVASAPPATPKTNAQPAAVATAPVASPAPERDSIVRAIQHQTQHTAQRARELASGAPAPSSSSSRRNDDNRAFAYQLVVMQHLVGSEAMITAFRSSARRGAIDAQLASWSRDLLNTTRLLETSPAAQDPTMRRLLEDLDLVISQIAQYTTRGQVNTDDLDLIEQSIDKRGVMQKLRSLPGRNAPAGT